MKKRFAMSAMVVLAVGLLGLAAGCLLNKLDASSKDIVIKVEKLEGTNNVLVFLRSEHLDRLVCQDLAGKINWQVPFPYRVDRVLHSFVEEGLEGFAVQYATEPAFSWVDIKTHGIKTFLTSGDKPPLQIEKFGDKFVATSLMEGGRGLILELFGLEGDYKKVVLAAPPKKSEPSPKPKMAKGGI